MGAQTVITHALTLAKAGDPVCRASLPARMIIRPTVIINGHPRWERVWSTPRASIALWVSDLLAAGEYAAAGELSAYLHAPAPRLPVGVIIFPTD